MNSTTPARIAGLSEIADKYDTILCDVWGVVHNGVASFPAAREALARFREAGGKVLLITNAPRPNPPIFDQLAALGVSRASFDDVLTSGDVTRDLLGARPGAAIYHLGPDRDRSIYDGLPIRLVDADEAEMISCTGLFDDNVETPSDYRDRLAAWSDRGLPLVCANPDLVVERGTKLIPCAGALAALYVELGGTVMILGKPHASIYEAAFDRVAALRGHVVGKDRMLAIGDGIATDVRGAFDQGIDVLFITAGIHAAEFGSLDQPDRARVHRFLEDNNAGARAFVPRLRW